MGRWAGWLAFLAAGAAMFLLLPSLQASLNPYKAYVLVFIGINIILAASLNLINGYTGQFSLGHAGFMAVGAYVACFITYYQSEALTGFFGGIFGAGLAVPLTFLTALLAGGLAAAFVGVLVGWPSVRLKGDYLAIATLGFGEIARVITYQLDHAPVDMGGARGLSPIAVHTNLAWVGFWVLVTLVVIRNLLTSVHGRAFLAIREDEVAAEGVGIPTTRYKVIAFSVGAFFAGVAGALVPHFLGSLHPNSFTFLRSIEVVVFVVLGGMGSMVGTIGAAVLLTLLLEVLRGVSLPDWMHLPAATVPALVVVGAALLVLALASPMARRRPLRYALTALVVLGAVAGVLALSWNWLGISGNAERLRMPIFSLLLVFLMLFRPQGLLGNRELSFATFRRLLPRRATGAPT